MVYSRASIVGGNPACLSVSLVTGPIEARWTPSRNARALSPRRARKLLAVDELVKVITCGLDAGSLKSLSSFSLAPSGTRVSYASITSTCSHFLQLVRQDVPRNFGPNQQDPAEFGDFSA